MPDDRGYFKNSLHAWHEELLARERQLRRRHEAMVKMKHPAANDQAILIDINRNMITLVESQQRVATSLEDWQKQFA